MKNIFRKFIWFALAILAFSVLFTLYSLFANHDLCDLAKVNPKTTAFIEQRKEEWADKGSKRKIYQIWVPLSSISPHLRNAVVLAALFPKEPIPASVKLPVLCTVMVVVGEDPV